MLWRANTRTFSYHDVTVFMIIDTALRLTIWAAHIHARAQACPGRVVDKPVLRWGAPGACPAKTSYAAGGRQCRYSCMAPTTRL